MKSNYYEILGVDKSATQEEIKKAYRNKAKEYHPDQNKNTEDMFKKISEAYNVLKDPETRKRYDYSFSRPDAANSSDQSAYWDYWEDFFNSPSGGGHYWENFFYRTYSTEPTNFYSHNKQKKDRYTPTTENLYFSISALDAVFGSRQTITVKRKVPCSNCGVGKKEKCKVCEGKGSVSVNPRMRLRCAACGGTGTVLVYPKNCEKEGCVKGYVEITEHLKISIPAGSGEGTVLRIKKKGNSYYNSSNQLKTEDLLVVLALKKEELPFKRKGNDIEISYPITIFDALFGGVKEVKIPTIDGYVYEKIYIPEETQEKNYITLKGKGVPGTKGNMIIRFNLIVPRISKEIKDKIKGILN